MDDSGERISYFVCRRGGIQDGVEDGERGRNVEGDL